MIRDLLRPFVWGAEGVHLTGIVLVEAPEDLIDAVLIRVYQNGYNRTLSSLHTVLASPDFSVMMWVSAVFV